MAMISCPKCGKQISDKASACPNCGASFVPTANFTNAAGNTSPTQQAPQFTMPAQQNGVQQSAAKTGSKAPVVIAIIAVVAALAAVFFIFFKPGGNQGAVNNGGSVPDSIYTPPKENSTQQYNVTLVAECERNSVMNKYDVDILFDDQFLDTLPHGATKEYRLPCTEGSHKIEFRLNAKSVTGENLYNVNDPGSFQIKTINVNQNESISYHIEIDMGNTLNVSRV